MALVFFGSAFGFNVFVDDSLGSEMNATGSLFLANCTSDLVWMSAIFGGITPPNLPFTINIGTTGFPGVHAGCDSTTISINVMVGPGFIDPAFAGPMGVAETAECFEAALNNGWNCEQSNGEGLSGIMAWWRYPVPMANDFGPRGGNWLRSSRPDWVTNTENTDQDPVSSGCAELFINFLRFQLHFNPLQIVQTGGATLADTYAALTRDNPANAFPRFNTLIGTRFPPSNDWTWADDSLFPIPFGRFVLESRIPFPDFPPLVSYAGWVETDLSDITEAPDFGPICSNPALENGANIPLLAINEANHLIFLYAGTVYTGPGSPWQIINPADQFTVFGNPCLLYSNAASAVLGYARDLNGNLIEVVYQEATGWNANNATATLERGDQIGSIQSLEDLLIGFALAGDPAGIIANGQVQVYARAWQIDGSGDTTDALIQYTRPEMGGVWDFTNFGDSMGIDILYDPVVLATGTTVRVYANVFGYDLMELQLPAAGGPMQSTITTGTSISGHVVGNPAVVADSNNVYVFTRTDDDSLWMLSTPISGGPWNLLNVTTAAGDPGIAADPGAVIVPVTPSSAGSFFVYARSVLGCLMEFRKDPDPATWIATAVNSNDVTGRPAPFVVETATGVDVQILVTSASLTADS